jgi:hypothetical protein
MEAMQAWQPHVLVQFEDFGNSNAFRCVQVCTQQDSVCPERLLLAVVCALLTLQLGMSICTSHVLKCSFNLESDPPSSSADVCTATRLQGSQ